MQPQAPYSQFVQQQPPYPQQQAPYPPQQQPYYGQQPPQQYMPPQQQPYVNPTFVQPVIQQPMQVQSSGSPIDQVFAYNSKCLLKQRVELFEFFTGFETENSKTMNSSLLCRV